jgi:NADH:ubiquinone oxidoreductase subunit 2 (subunit N)
MEHITMMFLSVALLTVGSSSAKRKRTDKEKFKTIAVFFTLGLLIIFLSVPWAFSPFTSRPYFRLF